jgi:hypothetical protein
VQGSGSAPGHNGSGVTNVTPSRNIVPDFDDYGLGCVLLAGSEVAKLSDATQTKPWQADCSNSRSIPQVRVVQGNLLVENRSAVPMTITISNALGRVLQKKEITGSEQLIPMSASIGPGVYFVELNGKDGIALSSRSMMVR